MGYLLPQRFVFPWVILLNFQNTIWPNAHGPRKFVNCETIFTLNHHKYGEQNDQKSVKIITSRPTKPSNFIHPMNTQSNTSSESATRDRYAAAAHAPEAALCCPVDYDPQFLQAIPTEVIEKDYGCGDPSKHLLPGETVLDLGSGTGKICFIASQVVGPSGKVIGVDMTDAMLEVARRNAPVVAQTIGYANVEFRKGRIQDLALDLELFDQELRKNPISSADSYLAAEALAANLRITHPLIVNDSIDVVVSNCVLNLVETHLKRQLFEEIFRVLKKGGRAVISDIVSDKEIPLHLQNDPHLWSGCISGAYTDDGFLMAFEQAGFQAIEILKRDDTPWQIVEGIEFRSVTIEAWKGETTTNHFKVARETPTCCGGPQ